MRLKSTNGKIPIQSQPSSKIFQIKAVYHLPALVLKVLSFYYCGHTYAKYLAKRVEAIHFLLNLLAYSEIIGFEKTKENYF